MAQPAPLSGVKVLEMEGIGPCPLAACVLADFGAEVITVCRAQGGRVQSQGDPVSRGKRSMAVDVKSPKGAEVIQKLVSSVDVFLEPFRPGVMEKLGLGPEVLCGKFPRLIYGRMTGFGQGGSFSKRAGHDNNYIALSGVLDFFRRGDERPFPPANFAGDYAGGAMIMAMGVLLALLERHRSGRGQVIDAAMLDGANYTALPLFKFAQMGWLPVGKDGHMIASDFILCQAPPWSEVYLCKEDPAKPGTKQYVSVQAIEPQFYAQLLHGLGLPELPQYDRKAWPELKRRFAEIFQSKTRQEWADIFEASDACCVPVLNALEAAAHPHNRARQSFAATPGRQGLYEPAPAPKLMRTPGHMPRDSPVPAGDTRRVLSEYGFSSSEVETLLEDGVICDTSSKLSKL